MDIKWLHRLRNPPQQSFDIEQFPDLRLGLEIFLVGMKSSVDTYVSMREAILRRHSSDQIPTYDQIKRIITEITGVTSVAHPMCRNSCIAFTGPFSNLDQCPKCGESKLCSLSNKPFQEFHTILLGPILQALWREPSSAQRFGYRLNKNACHHCELESNTGLLSSYDDFFHGSDYLESVRKGEIGDNDIVLMLSIDGAQLFAQKASDCWIYLWVIMDLSPNECYKKQYVPTWRLYPWPQPNQRILTRFFSRPTSSKHFTARRASYMGFFGRSRTFLSKLFLALNTADGPGMAYLNGLVGHHGKYGCRALLFRTRPA